MLHVMVIKFQTVGNPTNGFCGLFLCHKRFLVFHRQFFICAMLNRIRIISSQFGGITYTKALNEACADYRGDIENTLTGRMFLSPCLFLLFGGFWYTWLSAYGYNDDVHTPSCSSNE